MFGVNVELLRVFDSVKWWSLSLSPRVRLMPQAQSYEIFVHDNCFK